jgi:NitT/TauT family transport system substrate-binding protein
VDAATAFETPVVYRAAQDDLEVVTTLHTTSRTPRGLARADRGIAREGDLAGKRIGVTPGTHAEYFLRTLLAYAGVESSARAVDLEPAAAIDALAAGAVDAIVLWSPHVERARRLLGPGGSVELGSDIHTEISMLVVRDATHQARRGVLVKLVSALADAERLVHERPEEAVRALRASFPELSDAELRDIWSRVVPALGLTHELAALLERQAVWFRSAGRIAGPPVDLGAVIDPDVLTAVDPEAVTFVSPPRGKAPR